MLRGPRRVARGLGSLLGTADGRAGSFPPDLPRQAQAQARAWAAPRRWRRMKCGRRSLGPGSRGHALACPPASFFIVLRPGSRLD